MLGLDFLSHAPHFYMCPWAVSLSYSIQTSIEKPHRLCGIHMIETYFSQFWRLEVEDQGNEKVTFWGESPLRLQMAAILLCFHIKKEVNEL